MSYTFLGRFPNLHLLILVFHVLAIKSVLSLATAPMKPYPTLEFPPPINLGFPTFWVHVMEYCVSLIIMQNGLMFFTCGTPVLEYLRGCPITSFGIGYGSQNNDFKVVGISRTFAKSKLPPEVRVYSLNSDHGKELNLESR